jgi:hypothetical protein
MHCFPHESRQSKPLLRVCSFPVKRHESWTHVNLQPDFGFGFGFGFDFGFDFGFSFGFDFGFDHKETTETVT